MEYCPGGHLLEILNRLGGKRMEEAVVLSIFCDVVRCVVAAVVAILFFSFRARSSIDQNARSCNGTTVRVRAECVLNMKKKK